MNLAPIILFVYNRPWHTQQTVEALQRCELATESDLYIFADGPKSNATDEQKAKISEVRKYIRTIDGFLSVTIEESETNKGLANSVISGVNIIIEKYGRIIVVEDDIVAHPFFLRFMNDALDTYQEKQKIFAISATMERFSMPPNYKKNIFLTYRFGSWGWASWVDRWNSVDWDINNYPIIKHPSQKQIKNFCKGGEDLWPMLKSQARGEIDSWAIRMAYNMSLQSRYCLRPIHSFVYNIGMDSSGIHCGDKKVLLLPMYYNPFYDINLVPLKRPNKLISKNIQIVFKDNPVVRTSITKKTKRWIKRAIGIQPGKKWKLHK